ncbi:flagellar biosynthesis protein FlhB [Pontibacterium sp. N1Y112]|uniref:Flagellar biosynthetic protein FlhB n=1 Tax=Pontibacterium sinense TaxID=2781979 RepID=A0A8J7FFM4_9GAMM|nr:flagellar biosynthesis protein FlhB [Pontibacterium sinense]MBE9396398.1 flagellar biosynthesis protein FlhB [Pontibacterium sinense]
MAEESGQEKSEEPTAKRLTEAREKGDVPRSRELVTMAVLLAASAAALMFGGKLAHHMMNVMVNSYELERAAIFDVNQMIIFLTAAFYESFQGLLGFFAIVLLAALIGPIALGGWNFSAQAFAPKGSRLNPLSGLKRMFSMNALVELIKALGKFSVVAAVAIGVLWSIKSDILALGYGSPQTSSEDAVEIVIWVFLMLSASLIIIAAIDVPFQLYSYTKKLKMTMQEIKDEYKNTEGKPEVKGRIRQMQREISQRQMMKDVPEADVVITNPTHYSVALKYDSERGGAPYVVALGADFVALKIREIAKENDIPILSAPPLARALYYSSEINEEIPTGLYTAVAQVLAYVFQLKNYKAYQAEKPYPPSDNDLDIPEEYRRDE